MIKERLAKLNNNYARKAPKAKTNLIQSYERIPNQKHGEKTPLEIRKDSTRPRSLPHKNSNLL